jgi:hypothetical protein
MQMELVNGSFRCPLPAISYNLRKQARTRPAAAAAQTNMDPDLDPGESSGRQKRRPKKKVKALSAADAPPVYDPLEEPEEDPEDLANEQVRRLRGVVMARRADHHTALPGAYPTLPVPVPILHTGIRTCPYLHPRNVPPPPSPSRTPAPSGSGV